MLMEDYNKIIEALSIRYVRAKRTVATAPMRIRHFYDIDNSLILLHKGILRFGSKNELVKEGEILFLPAGNYTNLTFGEAEKYDIISPDDLLQKNVVHLQTYHDQEGEAIFSQVVLDARVFGSVSFFTSLDLPPFILRKAKVITELMKEIIEEEEEEKIGGSRMLVLNTEKLVVEIIRFILIERIFVEKLATNSTYFKDPRLIHLFTYIRENIDTDLSNKVLASIANVSEDYVGQYFKLLTGINPQDYIEYQRMDRAVELLRTSKKSVRSIGVEVGYKDTAYFCRRFKMMFGIPAGKMRKRDSLLNVQQPEELKEQEQEAI